MLIETKKLRQLWLRRLVSADYEGLSSYLNGLSASSKKRFGPHLYEVASIEASYQQANSPMGYVAICTKTKDIVAYFIVLPGFLEKDALRFKSYDIELNPVTDCTFAPSVADSWQGEGLGGTMFSVIRHNLLTNGFQRVVLWGGVQADNLEALAFYEAQGFVRMGEFSRNGSNWDMMLTL